MPMIPALSPTFRRLLPTTTFQRLLRFWDALAERGETGMSFFSGELPSRYNAAAFASIKNVSEADHRYSLLVSPQQQALVEGEQLSADHYAVFITFSSQAIKNFLQRNELDITLPESAAADPVMSSPSEQLMLGLLEILNSDSTSFSPEPSLEDSLQASQVRVLSQVIAQIRQSLDLPVILSKAVDAVQEFLAVDRLIIYQFHSTENTDLSASHNPSKPSSKLRQQYGKVTYEARRSPEISSLLNVVTENDCFVQILSYQQKYLKGAVVAVNDVETYYSSSYCLVALLQRYQIRAKLLAPIVVDGELWGLLVAHQCLHPRQWLDSEKDFLGQIGEHLAVAIVQSRLYSEVQRQKNTFEKRVIERTRELKDTLLSAQAANHLKSQFINNISHELRTPLTSIIGLSGTLLHWADTSQALPPEKQQHYLQNIQTSGKRLLDLINGIIELSQLESGQTALNCETFSLHTIAHNVLHSLTAIANNREIALELDYQINKGQDEFCADPGRLEQVLSQLLNNALKFTPAEGTVILRIWREQRQAIFQVEDTGIGITEQQLPALFEAFKAVGDNYANFYETSGIGLALTKQLVELHGGRIEVESSPGQGTIFTTYIPQQTLPNSQKDSETLLPPHAAEMVSQSSVIVIEEDEAIATLICELLTVAKYQVIWLIDTSNALRQVELLQPGLVIIDRNFSDVTKVTTAIKASHRVHQVRTFLLSESLDSEEWQHFSNQGIDDYLLKPIQPELLIQRIGRNPSVSLPNL